MHQDLKKYASASYLLSVQLLESFIDMGVDLSVIRYPMVNYTSDKSIKDYSQERVLTELLYGEAGLDSNGLAVEGMATFIATKMKEKENMHIVFVTDTYPTKDGMQRFVELMKTHGKGYTTHWIDSMGDNYGATHADNKSVFFYQLDPFNARFRQHETRYQEVIDVSKKIIERIGKQ